MNINNINTFGNDYLTNQIILNVDELNTSEINNTGSINTDSLYINGVEITPTNTNEFNGVIIQNSSVGDNTMNSITFNTGKGITQSTSSSNTLSSSVVSGQLTQNGNILQSSGSCALKDSNIGTITQLNNKYITQIGTSGSNTLRTTYISDLTILNSLTLPSQITYPTATYTGTDIIMNSGSIIQSGVVDNQLGKTDFIGDVSIDGSLTMSNTLKSCQLQNTTLNGPSYFVGNISQTSGSNVLQDSTFSNIDCSNNLTSVNTYTKKLYVNDIEITGIIDPIYRGIIEQEEGDVSGNIMNNITFNTNRGIIQTSSGSSNILSSTTVTGSLDVSGNIHQSNGSNEFTSTSINGTLEVNGSSFFSNINVSDTATCENISSALINTSSLYVNGLEITGEDKPEYHGVIIQDSSVGDNVMNSITFNPGEGIIQTSSSSNTFSSSNVAGQLTMQGDIVQTSGSNVLLDCNIGDIIQSDGKYITQTGLEGSNTLRNTYISDLTILNSLTLPSDISMPTATYTNSNIVMVDGSIIQSGVGENQFIESDFIGDVLIDGNLTMSNALRSCQLQNVSMNGPCSIVGDISQISGSNTFGDSVFSNVDCSGNITTATLNTSLISNEEFNTLQNIDLTKTIQNQLDTLNNGKLSSINVGSIVTETLSSGTDAYVTIIVDESSTSTNSILNFTFGIPEGPQGPKGEKGSKGDKGNTGNDGKDGSDGSSGGGGVDVIGIVALVVSALGDIATAAAVASIQAQVLAMQVVITEIEIEQAIHATKLLYQNSLNPAPSGNNGTRWNSEVRVNSGLNDQIILNPYGNNEFYNKTIMNDDFTVEGHTQVNTLNISNNISSALLFGSNNSDTYEASITHSAPATSSGGLNNQGSLSLNGSIINIGEVSNLTNINIKGASTNITGALFLNGSPILPFSNYFQSNGFINQWI